MSNLNQEDKAQIYVTLYALESALNFMVKTGAIATTLPFLLKEIEKSKEALKRL